jgi:hypothetical protein
MTEQWTHSNCCAWQDLSPFILIKVLKFHCS